MLHFSYFAELNQEQQEMNADNFADFLNDKSNLYKLSYQELKTLALQYPYSSNLQLLLTLKSKMEQHKDFEKNLAKAATLCPDRNHLLERIQAIEVNAITADNFLLKEDYLELKDLSQIEALDKIPLEPATEAKPNGHAEVSDLIKAQLQHDSEQDTTSGNNPFLNSSGKDYEDINLAEALLHDLSIEKESEITEPVQEPLALPVVETEPVVQDTKPLPYLVPNDIILHMAAIAKILQAVPIADVPETLLQKEPATISEQEPLPYLVPNDVILNMAAIAKILHQAPFVEASDPGKAEGSPSDGEEKRPKPSPKSSFTSWVQQFQPDHTKLRLAELMEAKKLEELKRKKKLKAKKKKKKKKQKGKKSKVIIIAQKSITENAEIATETLAELLTSQGQYEKAIQVYHRLNIMYPGQQAHFDQKMMELQALLEAE